MRRSLTAFATTFACVGLVTGCSDAQVFSASSTSRMVKPTATEDVSVDGMDPTGEEPSVEDTDHSIEWTDIPGEIWVREADYSGGQYSLTVLSMPGTEFAIADTWSDDGNTPVIYPCAVQRRVRLSAKVPGAIAGVNTRYSVTCHTDAALRAPSLAGSWTRSETSGGGSEAVFALGGPSAQGRPPTTETAQTITDVTMPPTVVSTSRTAKTLVVRAWAPAGATLSVDPAQPEASAPQEGTCTSKRLGPSRKRAGAQENLYEIECSSGYTRLDLTLTAMRTRAKVGEPPSYEAAQVSLPPAKEGKSTASSTASTR